MTDADRLATLDVIEELRGLFVFGYRYREDVLLVADLCARAEDMLALLDRVKGKG